MKICMVNKSGGAYRHLNIAKVFKSKRRAFEIQGIIHIRRITSINNNTFKLLSGMISQNTVSTMNLNGTLALNNLTIQQFNNVFLHQSPAYHFHSYLVQRTFLYRKAFCI